MSSIPSNQTIFEWCADLKKLDLYLNSINQSQSKEGVILLKTLLKKDDFPKNITCESIDDCFFFSLSTHQFQLVQAACKVILKTQLSLQIIESNTPINVQPVLFRSLLSYGRDFFGNDPQNNPIILYHRWIIRSSSNNIEFEINLDQNKKSAELLNELYVKMTEQLMSNSTTNSVDRLFCNQLAYELGEYYFAVDKHLAIDFLYKKKLDTHSHEELSYSLRNNLVNEAMNLQQEHSAIKIAICNALDLDEKMLDQIPLSCIQYLGNYFNEKLLKDIIEIFKKLFGNYPGVNMSANKREFIIQLIGKINNEDVWNYICKTEEEFSSLFVPYSHNIDSMEIIEHFDIIFDMSFQEIRNIRAAFYNFVKALTFRGNDYKLVLDFFVRIKKVVWIHQIFRSLMAGYLCETQRQKKYKKLNTQLYGPFTILMMSTSCATEIWPDRGLHQLRKVLNEKIKRIRYDITEILIDWCKLSAKNDNQPTYQTDLILSNIYYLQGSPLKSLSLDAIASMTFFFTRLEKIEESLVSFEQIIRCCISRKVFHQFNRDEITYIESSYLLDISLSNGSLKTSQFANYLWETQLLKYICSDATSCNEVVKWLKSILFEESPEMFPDSFVREAYKRYLFRPRIKLIGLDIDPKHLTKRIESIKQDFLVVLNDWISKDYE
nr:158_t:CDS:10 [Entrophospora candida]